MNDILKKTADPARQKTTIRTAIASMALNILLAAGKITGGVLSGAVSVIADGMNSLSDCGGNIIALIGAKASSKPADKEHPFGHARGEYVASAALSVLIIFLGLELFSQSIENILSGNRAQFTVVAAVALSVSVAVKAFMFVYSRRLGKKYSSQILLAASIDSLCDAIASAAALASLVTLKFTSFSPDGYVGCLIAVAIAVSGVKMLLGAISEQLGKRVDPAVADEIKRRLISYDGVYGIHALTVHDYVNHMYASVHLEVGADASFLAAHELADKIEQDFAVSTDVSLTVHLDPVVTDDPQTLKLRSLVETLLEDRYAIHDFRLVRSVPMRLIFEVGVPYDEPLSDEEIKSAVIERLYGEFGCEYKYYVSIERETTLPRMGSDDK